jgi:hypothetical protein
MNTREEIDMDTIDIENRLGISYSERLELAFTHGDGSRGWDEAGKQYLDFTSGWGVTCLGHNHPVITKAITEQAGKIIQSPKRHCVVIAKWLIRYGASGSPVSCRDIPVKTHRVACQRLRQHKAGEGLFEHHKSSARSATRRSSGGKIALSRSSRSHRRLLPSQTRGRGYSHPTRFIKASTVDSPQ